MSVNLKELSPLHSWRHSAPTGFPQLRRPHPRSDRLTSFPVDRSPKQRPFPEALALCSHTPGPIGEVSRLVAIVLGERNGQSHWTFGERNLLLGSEAIFGRGTRRRQQRQFDGLSGFSRRRAHQRLGRRGAAGDPGDSRRPRRGARTIDGRGVPARSFGRCGRNGRTQVLQRQHGVSFRRLLRPLQVAVRGTVHQRWRRTGIILSHGRGL